MVQITSATDTNMHLPGWPPGSSWGLSLKNTGHCWRSFKYTHTYKYILTHPWIESLLSPWDLLGSKNKERKAKRSFLGPQKDTGYRKLGGSCWGVRLFPDPGLTPVSKATGAGTKGIYWLFTSDLAVCVYKMSPFKT